MTKEQLLEQLRGQNPSAFLSPARQRGWVCPVCGNGSGPDGDGIVQNPHTNRYKCFKCGLSGDLLDLVGAAYQLESFPEKLQRAAEIYRYPFDAASLGVPAPRKAPPRAPGADCSAYFAQCRAAARDTDYFAGRGLSPEVVAQFGLGFDPDFSEGTGARHWAAAILPTSAFSYEARNTQVAPNDAKKGKYKYRKHGAAVLFNGQALETETEKPIFVCEGILDALSIIQCGGAAVALGSAVNYPLLLKALEKVSPAMPLVLLLDEDETGRHNAEKLAAELDKRKIPYAAAEGILEGYHDPNERLVQDAAGLRDAIALLQSQLEVMPTPRESQKQEYLQNNAESALNEFLAAVKESERRPLLSTGFPGLDKVLGGGLFSGLYVLGAISSLGKTTLSVQLADQLAAQGQDVLFFSLEQSRFDLMSKSISRESCLFCRENALPLQNASTNRTVLDGRCWQDLSREQRRVLDEAIRRYRRYAGHLYLYEGVGNLSVAQIRETVKNHISFTGSKHPVVCIDYLQILKAAQGDERAADKQVVDRNVTALKQLSRDFDLPVLAVSSLNRASYTEKIGMAAFKESGSIEYGSDVLLGLQLAGVGENGFDPASAKAKDPREVELCVLKNRNGPTAEKGIPLAYYPQFNLFCEARKAPAEKVKKTIIR